MTKKISILLAEAMALLLTVSSLVGAQQYVRPTQSTVGWNATVIPGETVTYRVYVAPLNKYDEKVVLGTTAELQFTVTIPTAEPMYVVGVSSLLKEGETDEEESTINWSDVNGTSTPNPFIYINLSPPAGLGIIQ
jgi:hypothetical protein